MAIPPQQGFDGAAIAVVVDHDRRIALGTGFYFLQSKFFITAKSVVVNCDTGEAQRNLLLIQQGSAQSRATVAFLHPSLDLAVLEIDRPGCSVPLYPSDQCIRRRNVLEYFGYVPNAADRQNCNPMIGRVRFADYHAKQVDGGSGSVEWILRSSVDLSGRGHCGGPMLSVTGGVVAVMTEGHDGWARATAVKALFPFVTMRFPKE